MCWVRRWQAARWLWPGALLQAVLGNGLAGPNIMGVNAGAGLSVLALSAFFPHLTRWAPLAAFIGALLAALTVYLLALHSGAGRMTLVLAGVAVSTILGAATDTLLTLYPEIQAGRMDFMIGGFSGMSMARHHPLPLYRIRGYPGSLDPRI